MAATAGESARLVVMMSLVTSKVARVHQMWLQEHWSAQDLLLYHCFLFTFLRNISRIKGLETIFDKCRALPPFSDEQKRILWSRRVSIFHPLGLKPLCDEVLIIKAFFWRNMTVVARGWYSTEKPSLSRGLPPTQHRPLQCSNCFGFVCKVVDVFVCVYLSTYSHSHKAPASAVLKLLLAQFKTRPLGL